MDLAHQNSFTSCGFWRAAWKAIWHDSDAGHSNPYSLTQKLQPSYASLCQPRDVYLQENVTAVRLVTGIPPKRINQCRKSHEPLKHRITFFKWALPKWLPLYRSKSQMIKRSTSKVLYKRCPQSQLRQHGTLLALIAIMTAQVSYIHPS